MNCSEFQSVLAEFVGGELAADQRGAAQRHASECRVCRARAHQLQAAAAALESLVPHDADAANAVAHLRLPAPGRRGVRRGLLARYGVVALRYAAVVALAFVCGYGTRGLDGAAGGEPPGKAAPATDGAEADGRGDRRVPEWPTPGEEEYAARLRVIDEKFPQANDLSRTLLLLAQR